MRAVLKADVQDTPAGRRVIFRDVDTHVGVVKVIGQVPGVVQDEYYAVIIEPADLPLVQKRGGKDRRVKL